MMPKYRRGMGNMNQGPGRPPASSKFYLNFVNRLCLYYQSKKISVSLTGHVTYLVNTCLTL